MDNTVKIPIQMITIGPVATPLYAVDKKVPIKADIPAILPAINNTCFRFLEC